MKKLIVATAFSSLFVIGCNNNQSTKNTGSDTLSQATHVANAKQGESANGIKAIIDSYLDLKNALTKDDDKQAAAAGEKLVATFVSFDPTALPEEQKKEYAEIKDDALEHAEHISKNAGNLVHQREHFVTLSKDIYDLVKTFGGGQALYLEHCPMYDNNKGAYWVSESKDIRNPYLGSKMLECGTVKEELKL